MYGLEEWLPDLIQCGVDINANDLVCTYDVFRKTCSSLLSQCGVMALLVASQNNNISVVKVLLNCGLDMSQEEVRSMDVCDHLQYTCPLVLPFSTTIPPVLNVT